MIVTILLVVYGLAIIGLGFSLARDGWQSQYAGVRAFALFAAAMLVLVGVVFIMGAGVGLWHRLGAP